MHPHIHKRTGKLSTTCIYQACQQPEQPLNAQNLQKQNEINQKTNANKYSTQICGWCGLICWCASLWMCVRFCNYVLFTAHAFKETLAEVTQRIEILFDHETDIDWSCRWAQVSDKAQANAKHNIACYTVVLLLSGCGTLRAVNTQKLITLSRRNVTK